MIQDVSNPVRKFAFEMVEQLEKHDEEKTLKFYDFTLEQCIKLLETQFLNRIKIINETSDKNEIRKQVTHLANYCYFVWSRTNV